VSDYRDKLYGEVVKRRKADRTTGGSTRGDGTLGENNQRPSSSANGQNG